MSFMKRSFLWALSLLFVSGPVYAADMLPPASQRFAKATEEVPSFQRHVLPLMGRR